MQCEPTMRVVEKCFSMQKKKKKKKRNMKQDINPHSLPQKLERLGNKVKGLLSVHISCMRS